MVLKIAIILLARLLVVLFKIYNENAKFEKVVDELAKIFQ